MALPQDVIDALRQQARLCRAEMLQRAKGVKSSAEVDLIISEVLSKHAVQITNFPSGTFSAKSWLGYYVRHYSKD